VIIVDHLQQLETKSEETRALSLAQMARRLKRLSLEKNIVVIALSQLNRELMKLKRKPVLSDLRESGGIEENADVVLLIDKIARTAKTESDTDESAFEIAVAKNRHGKLATIPVTFDWQTVSFGEETARYEEEI